MLQAAVRPPLHTPLPTPHAPPASAWTAPAVPALVPPVQHQTAPPVVGPAPPAPGPLLCACGLPAQQKRNKRDETLFWACGNHLHPRCEAPNLSIGPRSGTRSSMGTPSTTIQDTSVTSGSAPRVTIIQLKNLAAHHVPNAYPSFRPKMYEDYRKGDEEVRNKPALIERRQRGSTLTGLYSHEGGAYKMKLVFRNNMARTCDDLIERQCTCQRFTKDCNPDCKDLAVLQSRNGKLLICKHLVGLGLTWIHHRSTFQNNVAAGPANEP